MILAYLLTQKDYYDNSSDQWREYLQIQAKKYDIEFIDLIADFRKAEFEIINRMFIKEYQANYLWGHGHYYEEGNLYVAKILYDKLWTIFKSSNKLK